MATQLQTAGPGGASVSSQARILRGSGVALVAASWISAGAFGLYILAFYLGAIPAGHLDQWNQNLTGLYDKRNLTALFAMAAHLVTGAILLLLGPVQLIDSVRSRWLALHRWLGRLYVFTAAIAGTGGLIYILSQGTIGGAAMNAGFGLYGGLVVLAAWQTFRHARARRFDAHRAWAIRLFALAIGSWLYRMDYGFWYTAVNGIGHQENFRGPFDIVMAFFFYLPNLAIAEIFIRGRAQPRRPALQLTVAIALSLATLVVAVGTYYFLRFYWGPGIINGFTGRTHA